MSQPIKDPKTGVYKVRKAVPIELRPFVGKNELKRSLNTKVPQEAKARAPEALAELEAILANARLQRIAREAEGRIPKSDLDAVVTRWKLEQYRQLMLPEVLELYVEKEDEGYSSFAWFYQEAIELYESGYRDKFLSRIGELARDAINLSGIELTQDGASFEYVALQVAHKCLVLCNAAIDEVAINLRHLHRGLPAAEPFAESSQIQECLDAPRPQEVATGARLTGVTLSSQFESLISKLSRAQGKGKASSHEREYRTVVGRFIQLFGDLDLGAFTKKHVVEFRDVLEQLPYRPKAEIARLPIREQLSIADKNGLPRISPATVNKQLRQLSGVFQGPFRDGMIAANPCHGVEVGTTHSRQQQRKQATQRKLALDEQELASFFMHPVFSEGAQPPKADYGEAPYWIPVLLAYTGARLEEVAQLYVADIKKDGTVHYLDIDETRDDQSVKTGLKRQVPLHPHLLELGFLDYVSSVQGERLFPLLVQSENGKYSEHVGKYLRKLIKQDFPSLSGIKPLHVFRHTFITRMRSSSVREDLQDRLTGHSSEGSIGRQYGEFTIQALYEAICQYPRLPIPTWKK